MEFEFKNQVLGRDLKGLIENIENIENLEITKGKVSGYSIEIYDKTTETQGSYVYCKNMKQRDEDYLTLLEAIELNLEILENGR